MNKIKTILLSLTFVLLGQQIVQAQSTNNFQIKFDIKGLTATRGGVTIFGEEGAAKYDEIKIENGVFTFKGTTSSPCVARISVGQDNLYKNTKDGFIPCKASSFWAVIEPGMSISIAGSIEGKDYFDVYPSGNRENDLLAALNRKIMPLQNESVNYYLTSIVNTSLTTEQKNALMQKKKNVDENFVSTVKDFIGLNYNSIAALWIMDDLVMRSTLSIAEIESIFNKIGKKKYGSNFFYTSLRNRIEGEKSVAIGKKCPNIESSDTFDGNPFSLTSLKGKYVILDFWGTWCGPCVKGMPHMREFRDKHADKLQLVSISNDKDVKVWKDAVKRINMNWINLRIGKGDKDLVTKFNVRGFPTKILLSPDGTILYRATGESEDFYKEVEKLISK